MKNNNLKTTFIVTLLLTVAVTIILLMISTVENVSGSYVTGASTYSSSQISQSPNYDVYNRDYQDINPELEPVKVYHKFKKEGIVEVVKVVECNGNCNGKTYGDRN